MSGIKACIYSEHSIFCDGRPYGVNKQENDCRFCKEYPDNILESKSRIIIAERHLLLKKMGSNY